MMKTLAIMFGVMGLGAAVVGSTVASGSTAAWCNFVGASLMLVAILFAAAAAAIRDIDGDRYNRTPSK